MSQRKRDLLPRIGGQSRQVNTRLSHTAKLRIQLKKLAASRPYEFPVGDVCWSAAGALAANAGELRPWERLTFEYVLIRGVNDSDADARRVVRLLANLNCKVNLIALNPGPGIAYEMPEPERVASFQTILRKSLPCFLRKPRGRDIFAACGQLKRISLQ